MLQIIYRSNYWGKNLRARGENKSIASSYPPCLRKKERFNCQILNGLSKINGCCSNSKRERAFAFDEGHFLDQRSENWDLFYFYVDQGKPRSKSGHNFVLVPQSEQECISECHSWSEIEISFENEQDYIKQNTIGIVRGWSYLGYCQSSILRMELEQKINLFFRKQKLEDPTNAVLSSSSNPHILLHLDIFMETAIDREYPPVGKSRHERRNAHKAFVIGNFSNA